MLRTVASAISPEAIESFFCLAMGFAIAGLCASGYRLACKHLPSFRLLEAGTLPSRFAAVPLLMFSAPFIIMRNTVLACRIEGRRAEVVMIAAAIAGLWSLMSGTVVVLGLQALFAL